MPRQVLPFSTSALPDSRYHGRSIESSSARAAMAARRCSLPARASCARCVPARRSCGDPAGHAGGDRSLRRHSWGHCMRRRYGYPPESRGLLDTAAATRFSALVARSNPAVARVIALGALALVAVAAVVILFVRGAAPPEPSEALDPFVAAWSRGDDRGAAALTSDPAAARAALAANRRGLDGARLRASTQDVAKSGDTARATVRLSWNVPGIGTWSYRTRIALERHGGHWKVVWAPTVVHPRLTAGRRLGTVRDPDARAPILDRQGQPLVTARQVVRVGIDRATVERHRRERRPRWPASSTSTATRSRRAAKRAGPKQFVEARDAARVRLPARWPQQRRGDPGRAGGARHAAAGAQPGVRPRAAGRRRRRPPPSRSSARRARSRRRRRRPVGPRGALPGPAGRHADAPHRHPRRAPARPSRRCCSARAARGGAAHDARPRRPGGRRGGARRHQAKSALVAVQPSTGDILAVANRPDRRRRTTARSTGATPPGLDVQGRHHRGAAARRRSRRPTPSTARRRITVDGKVVQELRGRGRRRGALRAGLRAVVQHRLRLARPSGWRADALTRTARDFGLGRTSASQVPAPAATRSSRAATMIGQDRIVASPLAMAGVAATVADGRWHAPRLVDERPHADRPGARPTASARPCATLMRSVVTSGTGTALAGGARRGGRQERHRRVRRRRPAAHARLVHRLPRRPRHRRPRRERAARAARSPRRSRRASSGAGRGPGERAAPPPAAVRP